MHRVSLAYFLTLLRLQLGYLLPMLSQDSLRGLTRVVWLVQRVWRQGGGHLGALIVLIGADVAHALLHIVDHFICH